MLFLQGYVKGEHHSKLKIGMFAVKNITNYNYKLQVFEKTIIIFFYRSVGIQVAT
jgi:hypothetical protein